MVFILVKEYIHEIKKQFLLKYKSIKNLLRNQNLNARVFKIIIARNFLA